MSPSDGPLLLPKGVHRIELPMTGNPLGSVNCYLLEATDAPLLVDCGWDRPEVLTALTGALEDSGLALTDIGVLVVTHHHSDHYGLAGTLRRIASMPLAIHRLDWAFLQSNFVDLAEYRKRSSEWLVANGLQTDDREEPGLQVKGFDWFTVVTPTRVLDDNDLVGGALRVVWTPGHTPGHICLLDERRRVLLTGDHILDPITPNVGLWGRDRGDPLGDYLRALKKVADLDVDLVLPAHGPPFAGLRRRVDELLSHHRDRQQAVLEAVNDGRRAGVEVAGALPWTRRAIRFADLPASQQRLALTETLAHLAHLGALGMVHISEEHGLRLYSSSS